jgi:hypothetical protein
MKKLYLICGLPLCAFFIICRAQAQDSIMVNGLPKISDSLTINDIKDSVKEMFATRTSHFRFSVEYLSNNVYLGRKDSVITPYITPEIGYYHKSGLYANASASYLPTSGANRIDLVTVEAGYNFLAGNFDGQVSASKFWYNSQSYAVTSELKGSIFFMGGYDFGFIRPSITPTLNFSDQVDFQLTMGLDHSFYFFDDALDFTPTVNANAGTENFYNSYYRVRRYSKTRKKKTVTVRGTVTGEVLDAGQFKMLDYEFTLPINYVLKKFIFNFSPVYALPINPSAIMVTRNIPGEPARIITAQENLSNSFYFMVSVAYKL